MVMDNSQRQSGQQGIYVEEKKSSSAQSDNPDSINGLHKTELNLNDTGPSNHSSQETVFKTEVKIVMGDDPETGYSISNKMEQEKNQGESQTDKDTVNSNNSSSSSSLFLKPKKTLSRSTTQSRSSDSDQIGIDCEETDNVSSIGSDEDRSDFSSDYGTDQQDKLHSTNSSSTASSSSPMPELHELQERGPSPIPPVSAVISREDSRKRYDSNHSHSSGVGHDNLAFIAEESEPEDGSASNSSDTTKNTQDVSRIKNQNTTINGNSAVQQLGQALDSDNIQRLILRDFRREIVRSVDHQDGIILNTFLNLCKNKVG